MDHPLPLSPRAKLRFHPAICRYYDRFAKQLRFLRAIYHPSVEIPVEFALST
jgi:hypothetical protein